MRDIRQDLHERLNAIESRRAQLREELRSLDGQEQLLQNMIAAEDALWRRPDQQSVVTQAGPADLSEYILKLLNDGNDWKLDDLRDCAVKDGFLNESSSPGRSVHGCLLGLKRRELCEQVRTGVWRIARQRRHSSSSKAIVSSDNTETTDASFSQSSAALALNLNLGGS